MGVIPGYLLTETVTITPYLGPARFGTPFARRAQIQQAAEMSRPDRERTIGASSTPSTTEALAVWIAPGVTVPVGSRVVARGLTLTAVKVEPRLGVGLPVPAHIKIRAERTDFLADTTVTILRGTPTRDTYRDLVDVDTAVATGVEAAIVEQSQSSDEPVSQRGGVVETYTVRLRAGADVREGDRIRDDRGGTVYRVLDVLVPHPTTGPALGGDDITVTARRVTATS